MLTFKVYLLHSLNQEMQVIDVQKNTYLLGIGWIFDVVISLEVRNPIQGYGQSALGSMFRWDAEVKG